jgi:hypothetical protein
VRRLAIVLILLLGLAPPAGAAVAFVQSVGFRDLANSTTVARTFGGAVTAGNTIGVYVAWTSDTVNLVSVTDNVGNTYTLVQNPTTAANFRAAGAYARNVTGGSVTITATFDDLNNDKRLLAHEISGVSTVSPVDCSRATAQVLPGTGADAISSGSCTTQYPGDYIFGTTSNKTGATQVPGTGFTQRLDAATFESEDLVQSSPAAIAATFTSAVFGGSDTWITLLIAFNAPVVPPPTTPSVQRKPSHRRHGR